MIPLTDTAPVRNFPWMNWLIIVLNVAAFYFETALSDDQLIALIQNFGVVPERFDSLFQKGNFGSSPMVLITLLSSQFLHGGFGHLIGNLWTLYIFGDNIEDRMGPWKYLGSTRHVQATN